MNTEELNKILDDHKRWIDGNGGIRANLWGANLQDANLRGANLRGADLRGVDLQDANLWGANLRGANLRDADLRGVDLRGVDLWGANLRDADLRALCGNGKEVISLFVFDEYPVVYTYKYLQIGCERHKIEEWEMFDDREILEMGGKKAVKFWRNNKQLIFETIKMKPAKPTGVESYE